MGHTFLVADKVLVKWDNGLKVHLVDNLDVRAILQPAPPSELNAISTPPLIPAIFARAIELSLNEDRNGRTLYRPKSVISKLDKGLPMEEATLASTLWSGEEIVPAQITPCPHKNSDGQGTADSEYTESRTVVRVRGAERTDVETLRWLFGDIEGPTTTFSKLYGSQKYMIVWETGQHANDGEEEPCVALKSPWDAAMKVAAASKARQEMLLTVLEASCTTWRLWFPEPTASGYAAYEFPKLVVEDCTKQNGPLILNAQETSTGPDTPSISWAEFKNMAVSALIGLYEGPNLDQYGREGENHCEKLLRYAQVKLQMEVWQKVPINLVAHIADFHDAFKAIPSTAIRMLTKSIKAENRKAPCVTNYLNVDPETWEAHEGRPTRVLAPDLETRRTLLYFAALSGGHVVDIKSGLHLWPREVAMAEPTSLVWISRDNDQLRRWVAGCLLARIPIKVQAIRLSTLTVPNCPNLRLLLDVKLPEWPTAPIPEEKIRVLPSLQSSWALPLIKEDRQPTEEVEQSPTRYPTDVGVIETATPVGVVETMTTPREAAEMA